MYALNPLFATLMVHGDSTRSSLVALAVLDPAQAANLVQSVTGQSVKAGDIAALEKAINDKRIRKEVIHGLAKVGKKNKLNGYVQVFLPFR
jgi:long-chain acyl-CoA synthetase